MANKFDAFLDEPQISTKRKVENSLSGKVEKKKTDKELISIKIRKSAFEQLQVLKLATGDFQLDLLDQAIAQLLDSESRNNSKVKALSSLMDNFE